MKKTKWSFAIVALCMVDVLIFSGCNNVADGSKHDGNQPPSASNDPRNAVLGTYNNVEINGLNYNFEFYAGSVGLVKKSASGNMRAIMPDVPAAGGYFMWSLSGDTVIITFMGFGTPDSFTLDFSNSGGTKKLSNLRSVPAATYEWNEATKTLTFKGSGEIKNALLNDSIRGKVENIVIQDGVTIIGYASIASCTNLKSITIPNSVAVIGVWAFNGCKSLTSITLPDNTDVYGGAFAGCDKLSNIIVGNAHKYFIVENGSLYSKDKTRLVAWLPSASGTATIPNSVTDIGYMAFGGCTLITSVVIPNSVTSIFYEVFRDCISLSSVTIPNSVTSLGRLAFHRCESLTSVIIPDSVTSLDYGVFANCTSLENVTVKATIPPTLGTKVFSNCKATGKIYVPSASVSAYKTAAGWSEYASVIEAIQ